MSSQVSGYLSPQTGNELENLNITDLEHEPNDEDHGDAGHDVGVVLDHELVAHDRRVLGVAPATLDHHLDLLFLLPFDWKPRSISHRQATLLLPESRNLPARLL